MKEGEKSGGRGGWGEYNLSGSSDANTRLTMVRRLTILRGDTTSFSHFVHFLERVKMSRYFDKSSSGLTRSTIRADLDESDEPGC